MYTRQGHSPGVKFHAFSASKPLASSPPVQETNFPAAPPLQQPWAVTLMAAMPNTPSSQPQIVTLLETTLPWDVLGALPEMLGTVHGSLFKALDLQPGERLLIRGGTTSIGLAVAAVAKHHGAHVTATSRSAERMHMLLENGADEALVDDGNLAAKAYRRFDKVLELIGVVTLSDSLRCAKRGGKVCITGIAGNKWTIDDFNPMDFIPTGVELTVYGSDPDDASLQPGLAEMVKQVEDGSLKVKVAKVLKLEQIADAHRMMEESSAGGKIVVVI
jgi:NADPH:quinone reductase-like Zn-dependent oxidoreductase